MRHFFISPMQPLRYCLGTSLSWIKTQQSCFRRPIQWCRPAVVSWHDATALTRVRPLLWPRQAKITRGSTACPLWMWRRSSWSWTPSRRSGSAAGEFQVDPIHSQWHLELMQGEATDVDVTLKHKCVEFNNLNQAVVKVSTYWRHSEHLKLKSKSSMSAPVWWI